MKNKTSAIISLVTAVLFLLGGILAYSNGYVFELWGFIPLSGTAFFIIAALLFVYAIVYLVRAPKQDQEAEQNFQTQVSSLSEKQNPSENDTQKRTPLTAPCTVTIRHTKGILGLVNKIAVVINGKPVGEIKNKGSLRISTSVAENTISVIRSDNHATATANFTAESNGTINLNIIAKISKMTIEQQ